MSNAAFIVVDVQNDFCEGGALAVDGGASVARKISSFLYDCRSEYTLVSATRDDHAAPPNDNCGHFALTGEPDFVTSWPVHCVAGTPGAEFHPDLSLDYLDSIFYKGYGTQSYSGFEAVDEGFTSLLAALRTMNITRVEIAGLAFDYCVKATALDSAALGFETVVYAGLSAGVANATSDKAYEDMISAGVTLVG